MARAILPSHCPIEPNYITPRNALARSNQRDFLWPSRSPRVGGLGDAAPDNFQFRGQGIALLRHSLSSADPARGSSDSSHRSLHWDPSSVRSSGCRARRAFDHDDHRGISGLASPNARRGTPSPCHRAATTVFRDVHFYDLARKHDVAVCSATRRISVYRRRHGELRLRPSPAHARGGRDPAMTITRSMNSLAKARIGRCWPRQLHLHDAMVPMSGARPPPGAAAATGHCTQLTPARIHAETHNTAANNSVSHCSRRPVGWARRSPTPLRATPTSNSIMTIARCWSTSRRLPRARRSLDHALSARVPLLIGTTGLDHPLISELRQPRLRSPSCARRTPHLESRCWLTSSSAPPRAWPRRLGHRDRRGASQDESHAPSGTALYLAKPRRGGAAALLPTSLAGAAPALEREPAHRLCSDPAAEPSRDHDVMFLGEGDRLILSHRAESRAVFARGALTAARSSMGSRRALHDAGRDRRRHEPGRCVSNSTAGWRGGSLAQTALDSSIPILAGRGGPVARPRMLASTSYAACCLAKVRTPQAMLAPCAKKAS